MDDLERFDTRLANLETRCRRLRVEYDQLLALRRNGRKTCPTRR